jgi:hypothetical protein
MENLFPIPRFLFRVSCSVFSGAALPTENRDTKQKKGGHPAALPSKTPNASSWSVA